MSKKSEQWYLLNEQQLEKLVGQGTYSGAKGALDEVRKIKQAGQTASIYYSEFNGFSIVNESDPNESTCSVSMSQKAKRFQM